jgi:hypothetical protein
MSSRCRSHPAAGLWSRLKGKPDIGDKINKTIIAPLANAINTAPTFPRLLTNRTYRGHHLNRRY